MSKQRKKPLRKDNRVGEPARWSVKTLLNAYVEAERNHDTDNATVYATLLRARGQAIPKVVEPLSFGALGDKDPRVSYSDLHATKLVRVVHGDDVLGEWPCIGVPSDFNLLKEQYGKVEHKWIEGVQHQIVDVPATEATLDTLEIKKHSDWNNSKFSKRPLMCVYEATRDYLRKLLGVELSTEDENFFIDHPLVDFDGVPFPHTLRVVQELIDPYGLAISRVQVAPMYNIKGDILQWRGVLGCNPLAFTDRMTTNGDFKALEPLADTSKFNFEYTAIPLSPAIACGVVSGGAITGSTGGHATFAPPRRLLSGSLLSFQIGRRQDVTWKKAPVFPEVPAKVITIPKPNIQDVFDLSEWYNKYRKKGNVTQYQNGIKTTQEPVRATTFDPFSCYVCSRLKKEQKHTYRVPGCCDECWDELVDQCVCTAATCDPKAGTPQVTIIPAFHLVSFSKQLMQVVVSCARCQQHWILNRKFAPKGLVPRMVNAMHNYALDVEIDMKRRTSNGTKKEEAPIDDATAKPEPPDDEERMREFYSH